MKVHLTERMEPLKTGSFVVCTCNAKLEKAQIAFLWDFVAMTQRVNLREFKNLCRKCREHVEEHGFSGDKSFLYGVVSEADYALLIQNQDLQG